LQPYLAAATPTLCDAPRELRPPNAWRGAPPPDSSPQQTEPGSPDDVPSSVSGNGLDIDPPAPDAVPDSDREQIDALNARVARLQATIAEQQAEIATRRREVQELHLLLQRAQTGARPPPPPEAALSTTPVEPPVEAPRSWWERLLWWRR
jgi:hypothetical protein